MNINDFFSRSEDAQLEFLKSLSLKDGLELSSLNIFKEVIGRGDHKLLQPISDYINSSYHKKNYDQIIELMDYNKVLFIDFDLVMAKSLYEKGEILKFEKKMEDIAFFMVENKLINKRALVKENQKHLGLTKRMIEMNIKLQCLEGEYSILKKELIETLADISLSNKKGNITNEELFEIISSQKLPETVKRECLNICRVFEREYSLDSNTLETFILNKDNELLVSRIKNILPNEDAIHKVQINKQELATEIRELDLSISEEDRVLTKEDVKLKYVESEFEKVLRTRVKLDDPQFETYKSDLVISFIDLNMLRLALDYINKFEINKETLYLKLEILLRLEAYVRVIEEIDENTEIHKNTIEFLYIKASAYEKFGNHELALETYRKVMFLDPDYRKVKEKISEN